MLAFASLRSIVPEMPLTSATSKIYTTSNPIIKTKRKLTLLLRYWLLLLLVVMIPNLYGASLSWSDSDLSSYIYKFLKERKREKIGGSNPLSLSLSLHTYLYFSIIFSFSLIRVCLYLFDLSSGSWPFSHLDFSFFLFLYFLALCGLKLLVKMMKRARKVVMDSSPSPSPLLVGEEARARFKHQALLQDYEELLRETEAKKRKLQKTIQKKLKLTAEVKFLRRKYKSFTRNPSQDTPSRLKRLPHKKPHKKLMLPSVTFAQPQSSIGNANHPPQDKNQRAKRTETPSASTLFDLNKVSYPNAEEMEGIEVEWEPLMLDKLKRHSVDGEVAAHDLNPSIFKDVGNSSSHVGKRKISWQDQVALKV